MDNEKETELLDWIKKIETRMSNLEKKVGKLSQTNPDDLPVIQSEPDSDEPIIDG